jgi:hypothetical protein
MKTERYFVGPKLLGDMRDTISRVQGTAHRVNGGSLPGRPESISEGGGGGGGARFRMATFTGSWAISSGKTVTLYNASSTTETLVATNLLIPLTDDSASQKVCSVAYDRGTWFLSAVRQQEHEVVTRVTLQPTYLELSRKQIVTIATTLQTSAIAVTECDDVAATAEQINWFFG